ncbi:MAG: hypothetical protein HGA96_04345 [Desulfobulbaceae bacterium]|nr:hypothetical protein [Desulfobulbaceae bacterium]
MSLLEYELGKPLTPKELAKHIGFDEKFIRDKYNKLGKICIGRQFNIIEKAAVNAIHAWNEIYRISEKERKTNLVDVPDNGTSRSRQ